MKEHVQLGHHELALIGVLAVIALLVVVSLNRRNRNPESKICLDDLLVGEDGKASRAAFVMGGSFLLTSWVIIYQTINGTLTDLTFGAYLTAWVIPAVTKLIKGPVPPPPST
jgi:hypothetical protein